MKTLDDAWAWYQAAAEGMKWLTHLAKFWERLPWGDGAAWVSELEKDNVLRHVEANQLAGGATVVGNELDDFAILVLFSVFEANVRDHLKAQLTPEVRRLQHPSLQKAGGDVLDAIEHGSFGRLLDAFRLGKEATDLVTQVNQIRRHRNWVAHGRRPDMEPANKVVPKAAYLGLNEFLALIRRFDPLAPASTEGGSP